MVTINCNTVIITQRDDEIQVHSVGDCHSVTVNAAQTITVGDMQVGADPSLDPASLSNSIANAISDTNAPYGGRDWGVPMRHGSGSSAILQYSEEVFIWFDETGLYGGVEYSFSAAQQTYLRYVEAMSQPNPPKAQSSSEPKPFSVYPVSYESGPYGGKVVQHDAFVFVWYTQAGFVGGASDTIAGARHQQYERYCLEVGIEPVQFEGALPTPCVEAKAADPTIGDDAAPAPEPAKDPDWGIPAPAPMPQYPTAVVPAPTAHAAPAQLDRSDVHQGNAGEYGSSDSGSSSGSSGSEF